MRRQAAQLAGPMGKPSGHPRLAGFFAPKEPLVSAQVLVLNATYEPINICTVRRAIVLLLKERAEVVEQDSDELHAECLTVKRPAVIRLTSYVKLPINRYGRRITRRAIFARDKWTCQYCGDQGQLTVDHVMPRSKGGLTTWENIVASCGPCNRRKGNRLPHQVDMHPRVKPKAPRATIFIHVAVPTIPDNWQQYLAAA